MTEENKDDCVEMFFVFSAVGFWMMVLTLIFDFFING